MKQIILISGTSRGIGKTLKDQLNTKGYIVYGSSRNPSGKDTMEIQLDVTDYSSCEKAIEKIIAEQGRLDILINNAGSHLVGASEESTLKEIQDQMQLNFFGSIQMIKAVTRLFLEQGSGKIINMSSLGGLLALPFTSAYNASKFALEGYSESLRLELLPYSIFISNLEPAYINTGTTDQSIVIVKNEHPLFKEYRQRLHKMMISDSLTGIATRTIAQVVEKIIVSKRPRFRYKVGKMSKKYLFLKAVSPKTLFERMVLNTLGIPQTIKY
jgi:short-subunit dehydrogenase